MLDHRLLLISLLIAFLGFNAVPSLVQSSTADLSASHLVPIEVEPDAVVPDVRPDGE